MIENFDINDSSENNLKNNFSFEEKNTKNESDNIESKNDEKLNSKNVTSWTDEQKIAIEEKDKNLLVSASAGSGKTAVMTQRIVNFVSINKIPITNFLIVTFTKTSAQDMKAKIIKRLSELPQDEFILEQIDLIPTSDISDLHSFYSRLISTYFYEVNVDPSFRIIDEVESVYLKAKAIDYLFEKKEKNNDEVFFKLYDIFQTNRQDDNLKKIIFNFIDRLSSQIDGEKWFNETIDISYNQNLNENICAKQIIDYVCSKLTNCVKKLDEFVEKTAIVNCEKYYEHFVNLSSRIKAVCNKKTYIEIARQIIDFGDFNRIPVVKDEKFKFLVAEAKELNEEAKDNIKSFKEIFISDDENEIIENLKQSKNLLIDIFNISKEYLEIYSKYKKDTNGLDFNDLELFALKILSNQSICDSLKNKYKYIFVDEYQDINEIQEKIISLISSENNRFMVGDLKQSIYSFRNCNPDIFLEKYKSYNSNENGKIVKLNCNFRSDKKILRFVDSIFSGVMTEKFGGIDYENDSKFTAGKDNLDEAGSTTLCLIDTTKNINVNDSVNGIYSVKNHKQEEDDETKSIRAEAIYVAKKITEIMKEKIEKGEKISYSEFAVLVFSMKGTTVEFIDTLSELKIPVSAGNEIQLMEKPYIQEIINFIKYMVNSKDDYLLVKILKSRLFLFSDSELVKLRKISKNLNFYEITNYYDKIEDDELKEKIISFVNVVEKYKTLSKMMSIRDFTKKIIKDFKIEELNLIDIDGKIENENILKLLNSLPDVGVIDFFVDYENFSLKIQNECGGDAVKIMTVHKSKGIEFNYVFLVNTSRKINYDSLKEKIILNNKIGFATKSYDYENRVSSTTIPFEAIIITEKLKIAAEQQRVLYVALTRAVKKMFVVCSEEKDKICNNFKIPPLKYSEWFYPIIYNELYKKHNEELIFDNYSITDFENEKKIEKRELIFTQENVIAQQDFNYKFENVIDIPLKNSVSKILKSKQAKSFNEKNICNNNSKNDINNDIIAKTNIDENIKQEQSNLQLTEKVAKINEQEINLIENNVTDFDDYYEVQEQKIDNENETYFISRGTAYHKVFEYIDFLNLDDIDEQLLKLKEKLGEDIFSYINCKNIKTILKFPFFNNLKNFKIFTEKEFFAKMPVSLIDKKYNFDDTIIMQGVIDFLAISEDEIYILDYKTGKITDEKINNYKFQLLTYAEVCEKIFGKKVTKKILCFIDEQKMLEI